MLHHRAALRTRQLHPLFSGFDANQNLDLQIDALTQSGCHRHADNKNSGIRAERPSLAKALDTLHPCMLGGPCFPLLEATYEAHVVDTFRGVTSAQATTYVHRR